MKAEPKVGEVVTWDYGRYKCVETNERQIGMSCVMYCALGQIDGLIPCYLVRCGKDYRKDGKFVHFVKMAPRKRRNTL